MCNLKTVLLLAIFPALLFSSNYVQAQCRGHNISCKKECESGKNSDKTYRKSVIKVSAHCIKCKDVLEEKLKKEKGIVKVRTDLSKKVVIVSYDPKHTNLNEIRKKISLTGFDADDVPANKQAFRRLPVACQKHGN